MQDGNELPWVDSVKHLGDTLQENNSITIDMNLKSRVNSLIQEFPYASPRVLLQLVQTYACNLYGSNILNLFSSEYDRIYKSYNVALRTILKLPRKTHRYLLEPLTSGFPHLYTQLLSQYVSFARNLIVNEAF